MENDFMNYLIATGQVDEFLGYKPNCPICNQSLMRQDDYYYCDDCDKLYDKNLNECSEFDRGRHI